MNTIIHHYIHHYHPWLRTSQRNIIIIQSITHTLFSHIKLLHITFSQIKPSSLKLLVSITRRTVPLSLRDFLYFSYMTCETTVLDVFTIALGLFFTFISTKTDGIYLVINYIHVEHTKPLADVTAKISFTWNIMVYVSYSIYLLFISSLTAFVSW